MIRRAQDTLDAHSEETGVIGDRMDTDVTSGLEAGADTVLVLTDPPRMGVAPGRPDGA